ncbi:MAG: O-antigen ligase family protein [Candidatus Zixiibacteriota bacterium]
MEEKIKNNSDIKARFFKPVNFLIILGAILLGFSFQIHWVLPILFVIVVPGIFIFFRMPELGIYATLYGIVLMRGLLVATNVQRSLSAFIFIAVWSLAAAFLIRIKNNVNGFKFLDFGDILFLILTLLFGLNIFRSTGYSYGVFKTGIYLFSAVIPYFAIYSIRLNKESFLKGPTAVILLGTLLICIALFDFTIRGVGSQERYAVGGVGPIGFARSMGLAIIAAIISFEKNIAVIKKVLLLVVIFFAMFFILLSASRGPFLAMLLTVLFYLVFLSDLKITVKILIVLVFLGIIAFVINSGFGFMVQRFTTIQGGNEVSSTARFYIWYETLKHLLDKPILGYGTGGFTTLMTTSFKAWDIVYPHNIFLEFMIEHGIVGLSLLLILLTYGFITSLWLLKAPIKNSTLIVGKFAMLLTLYGLISAQVSSTIGGLRPFWIGFALLFSVKQIAQDEIKEDTSTNDRRLEE